MPTPLELDPEPIVMGTENDALERESAVSHVLGIVELVNIIFGFLKRPDNARNARVCKIWSEIALKIIWAEVDNLHALFSILAPLTAGNKDHSTYSFAHLPSAASWRRFEMYAMLVRTLKYRPILGSTEPISRAVLRNITQTRTCTAIFPSLHTLEWYSPNMNQPDIPILSDSFLFMHFGVKSFKFHIRRLLSAPQITEFLDEIPQRTPFLTEIDFLTDLNAAENEDNVCKLLYRLPSLQLVRLPKGHLTSRIAEALSAAPALRELHIGTIWDHSLTETSLDIPARGFSTLKKLHVAISFADAALIVDAVTTQNGLENFFISSLDQSRESDVKRILQICANKHRRIQRLYLQCHDDKQHVPLTFLSHRSLETLSFLTALEINHQSPIVMSLAELTSIIPSLTQLSRLCLNQSPLYSKVASFGLNILLVIARSCKHLKTLKLFLDATLPLPDKESYTRESLFVNLRRLSLGVSVITEETWHPVAVFLFAYLPLRCEFDYGAVWAPSMRTRGHHLEFVNIATERMNLRSQVKILVNFSQKVRVQERRWANAS